MLSSGFRQFLHLGRIEAARVEDGGLALGLFVQRRLDPLGLRVADFQVLLDIDIEQRHGAALLQVNAPQAFDLSRTQDFRQCFERRRGHFRQLLVGEF
jgi:hypothetical protein